MTPVLNNFGLDDRTPE